MREDVVIEMVVGAVEGGMADVGRIYTPSAKGWGSTFGVVDHDRPNTCLGGFNTGSGMCANHIPISRRQSR